MFQLFPDPFIRRSNRIANKLPKDMTSHLVLESSHHMVFFAAAQCKMWKAVQLVGCRGIGKEWTSFIGMTKNNSMHRVVPTLTKCDEATRYRTAVQTQTQEAFCFLDALFWLCFLCTADLSTGTGNLWGFQICVSPDDTYSPPLLLFKNNNSTTSSALQENAAELETTTKKTMF